MREDRARASPPVAAVELPPPRKRLESPPLIWYRRSRDRPHTGPRKSLFPQPFLRRTETGRRSNRVPRKVQRRLANKRKLLMERHVAAENADWAFTPL